MQVKGMEGEPITPQKFFQRKKNLGLHNPFDLTTFF